MKKRDEALPGLDLDEVLHPIWTKPDTDPEDPEHIRDLRWRLWSSMQPFDGRPNCDSIVRFAMGVHLLAGLERAEQYPYWLIGQIVRLRVEAMHKARGNEPPALIRLQGEYIETIVDSL